MKTNTSVYLVKGDTEVRLPGAPLNFSYDSAGWHYEEGSVYWILHKPNNLNA